MRTEMKMTPELYETLYEEEWRPVRYFPLYRVSNYGRIMDIKTGRILEQFVDAKGRMTLTLSRQGEQFSVRVHRMVAEAFCDNFYDCDTDELDVKHLDEDLQNNHAYNLAWRTRKEIAREAFERGTRRAPRMMKIRVIETGEVYGSIRECARAIGRESDQTSICKYLAGKASHVKGYHFELL